MTPSEHARDLKGRFTWESDGKLDSWHCMALSGPVRGDCDDFAVTLLRQIAGSWVKFWLWLITFKAVFWFVRDPQGQLHVTLWLRGYGYMDNQRQDFSLKEDLHKKLYPVLFPLVILKMVIGIFDKT